MTNNKNRNNEQLNTDDTARRVCASSSKRINIPNSKVNGFNSNNKNVRVVLENIFP